MVPARAPVPSGAPRAMSTRPRGDRASNRWRGRGATGASPPASRRRSLAGVPDHSGGASYRTPNTSATTSGSPSIPTMPTSHSTPSQMSRSRSLTVRVESTPMHMLRILHYVCHPSVARRSRRVTCRDGQRIGDVDGPPCVKNDAVRLDRQIVMGHGAVLAVTVRDPTVRHDERAQLGHRGRGGDALDVGVVGFRVVANVGQSVDWSSLCLRR